jgi:hypothetical protein
VRRRVQPRSVAPGRVSQYDSVNRGFSRHLCPLVVCVQLVIIVFVPLRDTAPPEMTTATA